MTLQQFEAVRPQLTANLAAAFEQQMHTMGPEKMKGVSWFSSTAAQHPENRRDDYEGF